MHDYVRNIHANDVYILCKLKLSSYTSIHRMFGKTGSEEKEKPQKLRLFGILNVTETHGFTALFIISSSPVSAASIRLYTRCGSR